MKKYSFSMVGDESKVQQLIDELLGGSHSAEINGNRVTINGLDDAFRLRMRADGALCFKGLTSTIS